MAKQSAEHAAENAALIQGYKLLQKLGPYKTMLYYAQKAKEAGATADNTTGLAQQLLRMDGRTDDGAGFVYDKLADMLPDIAIQMHKYLRTEKAGGGSAGGAKAQASASASAAAKPNVEQMFEPVLSSARKTFSQTPERIPFDTFKQHVRTAEEAEALAPGITKNLHRSIVPGDDGSPHVLIKNRQVSADHPLAEDVASAPVAQMGKEMQLNLTPLGTMIRKYGADIVDIMYPGIISKPNGARAFQEKYGTDDHGQLLIPAPDAPSPQMNAPPPAAPLPPNGVA